MRILLYCLWGLLPLTFFVLALWSQLERIGGKKKHEKPGEFLRQGLFVLICVLVAVGIERFVLPWLMTAFLSRLAPLEFFQIVLLPFILVIGAQLVGPSKEILISKAPQPTQRKPSDGSSK